MIATIVCTDMNHAIGYEGELLFHNPEDMRHFKNITSKGSIIVGRKTYDSLPTKPLPDRTNIIISYKAPKSPKIQEDKTILTSMDAIKVWLSKEDVVENNNGIYVIGGGQIYKELLPYCERIYITRVLKKYDKADTYFPNIDDMSNVWELVSSSDVKFDKDGTPFRFQVYDRCDYEIVETYYPEGTTDVVVTVKTFNGIKTVIIRAVDNNATVYADTWSILDNQDSVLNFLKRFEEYELSKIKE